MTTVRHIAARTIGNLLWCSALVASLAAGAEPTGRVAGTVQLVPMKALGVPGTYQAHTRNPVAAPDEPRAIVYLERDDGLYPPSGESSGASITQRGYQFRPGVSAIRTGTRVVFPNEDDEFHSVFSYSRAKRFDLGRFRKDEQSPVITFDQPGLVKIYCEIHKHMRSLLLVLDTPWFALTDTDGNFELAAVPAGEYRLRAFLPSEAILDGHVTVVSGQTTRASPVPSR